MIYHNKMPHVSNRKVKKKVYKKLQSNLVGIFSSSHSKTEMASLINDLLTPTERIMFAKRIAIILMLQEGYSFRAIEKTLKVTLQTVLRFWKMKKAGKFGYLKENKKNSFWADLERILQAGLPPRGKGRWKHVFESMERSERLNRKLYGKLYKKLSFSK